MGKAQEKIDWLYNPNAKPSKELSKPDQKMIQLGWDAARQLSEPKPDSGGLLTDKEIMKATGAPIVLSGHRRLVAKTASVKDAMFRQKVERVKTAPIICLCGSTRFTKEMLIKQWELTKCGFIVVSWCALPDDYFNSVDETHIGDQEGVKELVDEVHKRKIDLCDEVFVLNINGYIGASTASEIAYAQKLNKPITYWQALKKQEGVE